MSSNEDYLDSLLKSVTDSTPNEIEESDKESLLLNMEEADDLRIEDFGLESLGLEDLGLNIDELNLDDIPVEDLNLEEVSLDALGLDEFEESEIEDEVTDVQPEEGEEAETDGTSLEEAFTMTQEEIEQLLRESQMVSETPAEEKFDLDGDDLSNLLSDFTGEESDSAMEISELLGKADNNEIIDEDMANMIQQEEMSAEEGADFGELSDLFLTNLDEEEEPKKKKKRQKKEKAPREKKVREKKEKAPKEKKQKAPKEKKERTGNGFIGKIMAFLEEGEDDGSTDDILQSLQAQNDAILQEMKNEDGAPKKGKGKKEKAKKEKAEKKPKKEKTPKPKKEKPQKEKPPVVDDGAKRYFPTKKAVTIVIVCLMLMAAFLLLNSVLAEHSNKIRAKQAYDTGNYTECYQLLYGQELDEEQAEMFYRSELTLRMQVEMQRYHEHMENGEELEAVDRLVQFVYDYKNLLNYAASHGCEDIVQSTYGEVLTILQSYGLTEEDTLDIARTISDVEYTRALTDVVEGAIIEAEVVEEPRFEDMLPEEEARQP